MWWHRGKSILETGTPEAQQRAAILGILLVLAGVMFFALFVARGANPGYVVILIIVLLNLIVRIALNQRQTQSEKAKRFAPGQDMYTMIDRMVDDLDEDELAYLRRRLEEQDQTSQGELAQSIDELLDKRAEVRGKD